MVATRSKPGVRLRADSQRQARPAVNGEDGTGLDDEAAEDRGDREDEPVWPRWQGPIGVMGGVLFAANPTLPRNAGEESKVHSSW